ncbi:MAG: TIGR00282 family metallophosphoesterase [Clostridia bacterium]|nr:TIGR00282 family metallophosphoesterase [Clostridia bacterium]
MKKEYKILAIGDIVGSESTEKVSRAIGGIKREFNIDLVIANGENAASGNGLDKKTAEQLFSSGIDVITSGNHIWQKREMQDYIDENKFILRPANYPSGTPGNGSLIYDSFGVRVLVMNLLGTVYLEPLDSPFEVADRILEEKKGKYDISVLDIHAEATSEKLALANYLDGRINAVFGTHTHIQTADERILPGGTGYITDIGMCGAVDSILGVSKECVIRKFKTRMPVKFENPSGETEFNGVIFTFDLEKRKVLSVERVKRLI